jgi:hypothetical protein
MMTVWLWPPGLILRSQTVTESRFDIPVPITATRIRGPDLYLCCARYGARLASFQQCRAT